MSEEMVTQAASLMLAGWMWPSVAGHLRVPVHSWQRNEIAIRSRMRFLENLKALSQRPKQ